jgi:ubiquinone/menaquinone biosynthesis C-methylase UbiE
MPAAIKQRIQENYNIEAMVEQVKQAIERAGLGTGPLQWSDLVPFDQFHVRGLEATKELASDLQLKGGQSVLDAGSGLGGPARYLAAVHSVHVTGIDLTTSFIKISNYLSERAGLTDKLIFTEGDATELPFPDEAFDVVWTQHVSMNIQDKARLYKGFHRVLKAGGRLAIYDAIQGSNGPVIYPTPWAREEGISFIASERGMTDGLIEAGFKDLSVIDKTESAAQWFQSLRQQQQKQSQTSPDPLSPLFILGPGMGPAIGNFAQNVLEDRVRIIQIIARKWQRVA